MPRRPRLVLPGQPHHVIVRGVNREPIFQVEVDYRVYLGHLKKALNQHQCQLHAFVLMTNHVHLLITPSTTIGISKSLQSLGRCYVQYFNTTYNRSGTLWEGRFRSSLVDSEYYLLVCHRYIELNPYRAGMVDHPADYPWSSYSFNALGRNNPLLTPHQQYLALGKDKTAREAAYRSLFKTQIPDKIITNIREATNREWVLGNSDFRKKVQTLLNRQVIPKPRGGDRKSAKFNKNRAIKLN